MALSLRGASSSLVACACLLACIPQCVQADATATWWERNTRASVDVSSRVIRSGGEVWTQQALGLDVHKVFAGSQGDVGTLVFQPYLVRIDDAPAVPPIFDDDHDQALQWRIANFNYTGLGRGRFNIRVGHFELPFGLEQVVQTNGTLYQANAPATTGLKADWGASINGQLPQFEYELAFMGGGGNDVRSDADGYFAGRIGTPREKRWWAGVSALDGEVETPGTIVTRRRTGVDFGLQLTSGFTVMWEFARGTEDGITVRHAMAETAWRSRNEALFTYLQVRKSWLDPALGEDSRKLSWGLRFEPTVTWSASFEVGRLFDLADDRDSALAQIRFRW